MKRAAIYARVSTVDRQDVDLQLNELRQHALARGWQISEYVDQGLSGAKTKRPSLDTLMMAARRREIDVVLVWKLDRLGRSLSHLLTMLNDFQALGIDFISLREAIDMTTPTGKLMTALLAAFAEFEKDLIGERVRAGMANARQKGKRLGRKPTALTTKEKILRLHAEKLSLREIAKKVKTSPATVHRIVSKVSQKGIAGNCS